MKQSNKQCHKYTMYIFYILVFLIIFLSSLSPKIFNEEHIQKNDIIILCVTSLIGTILLYILILYKKNKYKEKFDFELTPEKKCAGGAYMHQSNEECKKLWSTDEGLEKLSKFNCFNCIGGLDKNGLYKGLPRNNNHLCEMSDGNWKNNCYSDDDSYDFN